MRGFSVHTVGGSAVGDAIDKNVKMMFVNFPMYFNRNRSI
jgi:hypothetical protein